MIANFFRSLEHHAVAHLLISGQATVLYGAATFSEDIDLWLDPTAENCARFLAALRECQARFYKLTPPLTPEHLLHGHGFHFTLPAGDEPEVFLDVMGRPPRVGAFAEATPAARWIETEWGRLHTIGLQDLVELKKTQRLEDYPIISQLALAWFAQPECAGTTADFSWALENIYTLPALRTFLEEHPAALAATAGEHAAVLREFADHLQADDAMPEPIEEQLAGWMHRRMSALQQADRRYWRHIITELKALRAAGSLLPEGCLV